MRALVSFSQNSFLKNGCMMKRRIGKNMVCGNVEVGISVDVDRVATSGSKTVGYGFEEQAQSNSM